MDPESKKLLEETFRLAEDNNRMLHKIRRVQKWSAIWQTVKILVILGVAVGAFYYIEPYLDSLINVYTGMSEAERSLTGGGGSLKDFLSNFQN